MSILTATRTSIELGIIPLNCYLINAGTPDARYFLAGRNVTDAVKEDHKSLGRVMGIENLVALKTEKIKAVTGESFTPVPTAVAVHYWAAMALQGNEIAASLLEYIRSNPEILGVQPHEIPLLVGNTKIKAKAPERLIRNKLQAELGGQIEVLCPDGRIDLLTSIELIEVKAVKAWKSAIGQVLIYGNYYPSHVKRIHLFGSVHGEMKSRIESHCQKLGISISWE